MAKRPPYVRGPHISYQDALSFVEEHSRLTNPKEAAANLWDLLTVRGFGGRKYYPICSSCQKQSGREEPRQNCQCPDTKFRPRRAHWMVSPTDLAKITPADIAGLNIRQASTRERLGAFLQWLRP